VEPEKFLQASQQQSLDGPLTPPQNPSPADPQLDDLSEAETQNPESAKFRNKPARVRVLRKVKGAFDMMDELVDTWTFVWSSQVN
jgi:hypothetical protein